MTTTQNTFTNTDRTDAADMADRIADAHKAGVRVTIDGREVHTQWNQSAAQMWMNGTMSVSVRQRSNPAKATDVFVKAGQSATIAIG